MSTTDEPETGATIETLEDAQEAGYLGTAPDPEPNESYTVAGVLAQEDDSSKRGRRDDPEPASSSKSSGSGSSGSSGSSAKSTSSKSSS